MNTLEYERMYRLEDSYWWFVARHRLTESILTRLFGLPTGENSGLTFLDIGCGTGAMSARLAKRGKVVSADFSSLALDFSKRRGLKNLVAADAMNLPFADNSFDALVAMDILEHLPDDCAAMSEFHRVLKTGGKVIASVPAYPHLWSEHDIALMHHRRYHRKEYGDRFIRAGFALDKLSHTMTLLYPIVALQRKLNARKPQSERPQAAMPMFPRPINSALINLLGLENALARRLNFPFGVTILCVATKK